MTSAGTAAAHATAGADVDALAARYWDRFLALQPLIATTVGDDRFDDRFDDPSPAGRAAFRDLHATTLAELDALLRGGGGGPDPSSEAAVTADALRFMCETSIELEDSGWPLLESIGQQDGPQVMLPYLAQAQRTDSPERLDRFIARLAAYPRYIEAHIERIADARAQGVLPVRVVVERVAEQLERLIAEPANKSPIVTRTTTNPADAQRVAAAVDGSVRPANARLLAAVREILPVSRPEPGFAGVPGGMTMYEARIHRWTTLRADPAQLHQWGHDELAEIEDARRLIAGAAGHGGDTAAYRASLAADPANVPASREALLGRMSEDLERARAAAPRWFGRQPRAACEIVPIDASMEADALGYYIEPPDDGSRPGRFFMNTSDLPKRLFTRFATVTYHETIPGHHFQLTIEVELDGLSAFRRQGPSQVCGAFIEGWGLYSERLADEMGLFRNEGERFGMLDAQAWRAGRLVVDTGMHAFGWERDRAVDFLAQASGFERADAAIEVDRYIAIPAQALAYKVGQREIMRLRAEAASAAASTGVALDIRRFHDELLGHGSLPLEVLAAHVPIWLAADGAG